LVGGPYQPPRCKVGQVLSDRLRGEVIVSAISDAPIPWPMGRAGRRGSLAPILTAELERAVRTEFAVAVRYWWGVGVTLVWKWRRDLGVRQKLSRERSAELKRRVLTGERQAALAREFGVSRQWVSAIAKVRRS
jgi:hypothetical protein